MKTISNNIPEKLPFTKEGYEKVKRDYQKLTEKRKEILVRLQAAREMGDLSENGAYTSAKFELRSTDRELRRLKFLIRFGEISEADNKGIISFGTTVVLNDGKDQFTYKMVGQFESNPSENKLSINSPLGKMLMGKKAGDVVELRTLDGVFRYTIDNMY